MTEPLEKGERGSSVVDFALVAPLLVAFLLAVVQVTAWVGQRAAALDAAFVGAREGARTPGGPAERTDAALGAARAALSDPSLVAEGRVAPVAGVDAVVVDVAVPLRLFGIPVPVAPASSHMAIEPR